jgi:hypothetical protein
VASVASWISKSWVRIEDHGGEVPGDFEGHETVQAAPDKNGRVVLVPDSAGNF